MDNADLGAVWLTLKLASAVTLLLLVGTPIACWLARTHSRLKWAIGAIVSLPLVLPPSVPGFYLLVAPVFCCRPLSPRSSPEMDNVSAFNLSIYKIFTVHLVCKIMDVAGRICLFFCAHPHPENY